MGKRKARANDFIGIPAGGKHQITSVAKDLTLVWIYGELKGLKRPGRILAVGDEPKVDGCVIIKPGMWRYERPPWALPVDMGVLYYGDGPIDMDYHYYDFHEYYFAARDAFDIIVDGSQYRLSQGECCAIRVGKQHKVLRAFGESALVWVEDRLERKMRYAHQHSIMKSMPMSRSRKFPSNTRSRRLTPTASASSGWDASPT